MRRIVAALLLLPILYAAAVVVGSLAFLEFPPVSTLMLARWATFRPADRAYVPLSQISPYLPAAVIASEDARFCAHHGVDWQALREVVADSDEDGPSRGASTITMQTAKNLFLWSSRSYIRKGLEIPIALYLDLVWSKRRVMEVYLNIAEWGDGIFGAEAAARAHFGKAAKDLTRREAALLATSLPNPFLRDPAKPGRRQRLLAAIVGARMAEVARACLS